VLTLSLFYLCLRTNIRFGSDAVIIDDALQLQPAVRRYNQIVSIRQTSRLDEGGKDTKISFAIDFDDGRKWGTTLYSSSRLPPNIGLALEYASQKSGVPFEKIVAE
jgi:hypothetical protein